MRWLRIFGRKRVKQYQKKVDETIKELNDAEPLTENKKWDEVVGFHNFTAVDIENKTIDPGSGVTVKLFVNLKTWEIKTFYFKEFLKD